MAKFRKNAPPMIHFMVLKVIIPYQRPNCMALVRPVAHNSPSAAAAPAIMIQLFQIKIFTIQLMNNFLKIP